MLLTFLAALIAVAIGIALSYVIQLVPRSGLLPGPQYRPPLPRPGDRLYPDLRARRHGHPVLRVAVPDEARRGAQGRASDPRQHPAGGLLDGDAGALLLGLIAYSFVVLHDNEKKPSREILVGVTAQQFAWSFQYPPSVTGGRTGGIPPALPPRGESVNFQLHSKDVIHAFWIPAFRLQEDVVPGITVHYPRHARSAWQLPDRVQPALAGLGTR